MKKVWVLLALIFTIFGTQVGFAAEAPVSTDPVVVGPDVYKKVFENDRVRVCEIDFKPGASIAMHSHPDHFVYVKANGTLKLSYPDGTSKDFVGTEGQGVWIPAESHSAVNASGTEFKAVGVELKPQAA